MGAGKEEKVAPGHPRCTSSRGVQVTPDEILVRQRTASTAVPNRTRSRPGADSNARVGGGSGSGRIMWRWPSRRLENGSSLGTSDDCLPPSGGAISGSPLLRRLGGGHGGKAASATAGPATATTAKASLARVRKRRQHPRRGGDRAAVEEAPALTSSSSSPEPLLNKNNNESDNPERLVASLLLSHAGVNTGETGSPLQQEQPISPATSTASDNNPGWAERAGLTGGVPAAAAAAYSAATVATASSAGAKLDSSSRGVQNDRDVPRFLRPVMLLLSMSLLALLGTTGVGREVGVFGPAVHAAGGAALPEAVVDDIFDRADIDHDGVIADTEIQHVRYFFEYFLRVTATKCVYYYAVFWTTLCSWV